MVRAAAEELRCGVLTILLGKGIRRENPLGDVLAGRPLPNRCAKLLL